MTQGMYSAEGVAVAMGDAMGEMGGAKAGDTVAVVCADGVMISEMSTDFVCRCHFIRTVLDRPLVNLFL